MSTQLAGDAAADAPADAPAPPTPAPDAAEAPAPDSAPAAGDAAAPEGEEAALADAEPTFGDSEAPKLTFESGAFSRLDNGYFRMGGANGEEPVLICTMGPQEVTFPIESLPEQFGIDAESADNAMLQKVAAALKYVSLLRIGDPLPSEIVTGEASWQVPEKAQTAAYQRVTIQLADALFGNEKVITDPEQLEQLADDPQVRKRVSDAITEAAKQLDLGAEGRETVLEMIEDLANELAYIETLRGRVEDIFMIRERVDAAIKMHGRDMGLVELARSVSRLLVRPEREFALIVDQADAQTGEIMAVLKNLPAQIRFIRMIRDELHCRLLAFADVVAAWREIELKSSYRLASLLRDTHRFLAPRYMTVDKWEMVSRPDMGPSLNPMDTASTEMVW